LDPTKWLTREELTAWTRLVAVLELLPGALDSQLRRDAHLTRFEYQVLAMLSETPDRTLRMTALAAMTNATLPRLSHVVRRLADRGLADRSACPEDGRATNVRLTDSGWSKVKASAPGHVAQVRSHVFDALTPEQVSQLSEISQTLLTRLDPDGVLAPIAGPLGEPELSQVQEARRR
jgi:DNA-binding MarR family transcriptional regulator